MRDGTETCAAGLLNNTDCYNSPTHTSDTLPHVRNIVFLLQNMNLTVSHLTHETLQQQKATQMHLEDVSSVPNLL
jgi:hypothetical protein